VVNNGSGSGASVATTPSGTASSRSRGVVSGSGVVCMTVGMNGGGGLDSFAGCISTTETGHESGFCGAGNGSVIATSSSESHFE